MDSIFFGELRGWEDDTHFGVIFTALLVDDDNKAETIKAMNDCKLNGFLREGTYVTDILHVTGNVKNDRKDCLIVLNNFGVNPIARLNMPDIKWIEDYIVNFADDFGEF